MGGQPAGDMLRRGQAQQQRDVVTRYQREDLQRKLAESQSTAQGLPSMGRASRVPALVAQGSVEIDRPLQVWGRRIDDDQFNGPVIANQRSVGGVTFAPNGAIVADGTSTTLLMAAAVENFESANGRFPGYAVALTPPSAAGLASRDVDIPLRGTLYCFSTPGGDAEITARAVPERWLTDGGLVACLAGGLIVVLLFVRLVCRGRFNWLTGRAGSWGLIVVGVFSFCLFPILGLLMMGGGLTALATRATLSPHTSA